MSDDTNTQAAEGEEVVVPAETEAEVAPDAPATEVEVEEEVAE